MTALRSARAHEAWARRTADKLHEVGWEDRDLAEELGVSSMVGLRLIKGRVGPALLLDDGTLETLTDEAHCTAMRAFQRRIVYTNGSGDWLVNVESAALLDAEELPLGTYFLLPWGAAFAGPHTHFKSGVNSSTVRFIIISASRA